MPIYLGNQKIKTLYVGGQKIKEAWTVVGGVLTKVYSATPPFTPSGMTKNASAQSFTGLTPIQVAGMTAEAGSTLSGSALLPNGAKVGASVACQAYCTGIGYGNTLTVQVRKNGVLIPGASITTPNIYVSTYTVIVPTVTTDVVATDQISIWVNASSSGSATIAAGNATFVRIT